MDSTFGTRSIAELHCINSRTQLPIENSTTDHDEVEENSHSMNSTYVNAAFEFESTNPKKFVDKASWRGDDALVYANLSEIARRKELEDIDRRPYPPYPDATSQPLRIIANGWREYRTLGGRTFYFHPENGICQWKPPRTTASCKFHHAEKNSLDFEHENYPASTSTESTEFFAEIPLHRDLVKQNQSSNGVGDFHKSVIVEADDDNLASKKGLMSHSLDGGMGSHQHEKYSISPECRHNNDNSNTYDTPSNISNQRGSAIKYGLLEKCKLAENGVKLKRKDWCSAYAYLYIGHLLFYKDQKSAEKTGKHYPAPTDVCDLRNAILTYVDANEKPRDKRRKNVISLLLLSQTEYYFSCNEEEVNDWFHALRQSITSIPAPKLQPNTIISDYNGSLQRSLRQKRDFGGTFPSKSTLHSSIKSRLKSSSTSKTISEDHFMPPMDNSTVESSPPARATIIERLLRFFRSRPSMDSLRERGIYKPEPVFGSTLVDICSREKTCVPKFVTEVTALIEQRGIDSDGLYRVNGNLSSVQKIRCQIDQDCYDSMRREEDIHVLSGTLKLFLRELQEPIFPVSTHKDFMSAMRESGTKRLKIVDDLLLRLPSFNRETLRILILHLNRVATHSGRNRMQVHNLAIIFGPSLFCSDERGGHLRKPSQDKGKNAGGKRKSLDKKAQQEEAANNQQTAGGPTQNLAYRMIVYGQILEFILSESERLTIFRGSDNKQQQN